MQIHIDRGILISNRRMAKTDNGEKKISDVGLIHT